VQLSYTTVIAELISKKHCGIALSVLFGFMLLTDCFGVPFTRLFILNTKAGWKWLYYIDIIFSGLTTILYYLCYQIRLVRRLPRAMAQAKRSHYYLDIRCLQYRVLRKAVNC
jgi:hypothetical protein